MDATRLFSVGMEPSAVRGKTRLSGKKKKRAPGKGISLNKREQRIVERWESGIEEVAGLLARAARISNRAPQEQRDAIIKTEVYRIASQLLQSERSVDVEVALAHKIECSPRVKFKSNPYYWALKAVSKDTEVRLNLNVVSKFAAQLLYASQHGIPPELLTGFLTQIGGIRRIRLRLANDDRESWYRPDLPWL